MKPPKHKPDPRLKKSHAHPDKKKDYRREDFTWQGELDKHTPVNMEIIDWDEVADKSGGTE